MKLMKELKDIKFNTTDVYGSKMEVSEPIVMASAAGWYVGAIRQTTDTNDVSGGATWIEPFDRFTGYKTKEEAQSILESDFVVGEDSFESVGV